MTEPNTIIIESGWTLDTLKIHFDQRFDSSDGATKLALDSAKEATAAALNSAEKAIDKQEIADEKRFESQNAIREQLRDQASTFMPRTEAEFHFDSIDKQLHVDSSDISILKTSALNIKEQKNESWTWRAPIFVAVGSLVIALIAMVATIFIATHKTTPVAPTTSTPAAVTPAITTPAAIMIPDPTLVVI